MGFWISPLLIGWLIWLWRIAVGDELRLELERISFHNKIRISVEYDQCVTFIDAKVCTILQHIWQQSMKNIYHDILFMSRGSWWQPLWAVPYYISLGSTQGCLCSWSLWIGNKHFSPLLLGVRYYTSGGPFWTLCLHGKGWNRSNKSLDIFMHYIP